MRNKLLFISIGLIVLLSTSCVSSLKVRVEALNMPLYEEKFLNFQNNKELLRNLDLVISKEKTQSVRKNYVDSIIGHIKTSGSYSDADKETEIKYVDSTFEIAESIYISKATQLKKILDSNPHVNVKFLTQFKEFKGASDSLVSILNNMTDLVINKGIELAPSEAQFYLNLKEELKSVFGNSIISDPNASIIAALPKNYWRKYRNNNEIKSDPKFTNRSSTYNFSRARTFIGNADIAILMRSPGEFVVKGVRVDADEAVRTSFKVLNQGIKYLAASYGIPVKADNSQSIGKSIIPELDSLNIKNSQYEIKLKELQASTEMLLSVINQVVEEKALANPDKKESALSRIIKSSKNFNN